MELLRGSPVAERIDSTVRSIVGGGRPRLSVHLIGGDESSGIYARSKAKKGRSLGIDVLIREFEADSDREEVLTSVRRDAADQDIHGLMIERPLPDGFDMDELMKEIPPEKDVEGLHPFNAGSLLLGRPVLIPPTPLGALMMLLHYDVEISGKRVLVVGRSPNVGRPLSVLLSMKRKWANATVTLAHSGTGDLRSLTRTSDVIVTAAGRRKLVTGEMIKEGAVLVDLGINPTDDGIVGDVDIPSLEGVDCRATPTPGGTGPVTVSCMFLNLSLAFTGDGGSFPENADNMIIEIYG